MSPMDRLIAESVPDGTFGGARTLHRHQPKATAKQPDPKAAEHYAALADAIGCRRRNPTTALRTPAA